MDDPEKKTQPDSVLVEIRVIAQEKKSALVEYQDRAGMWRRCSIPAAKIVDGYTSEDILARGIPYGLQWEDLQVEPITPEKVANTLRAHGIWTAADIQNNSAALRAAIQQIHGPLLAVIYQFINRK
jgi:hypothetical protein